MDPLSASYRFFLCITANYSPHTHLDVCREAKADFTLYMPLVTQLEARATQARAGRFALNSTSCSLESEPFSASEDAQDSSAHGVTWLWTARTHTCSGLHHVNPDLKPRPSLAAFAKPALRH